MNSFETDLKRAFGSMNFAVGLLVECLILWRAGFQSELFQMSVPVAASLPYSAAWLREYQSGFIRAYLPRCGRTSYILGKFFSCALSGGTLLCAAVLFAQWLGEGEDVSEQMLLVFFSGMFWAVVSAALAAATDSSYVAYGGAFVLYYVLVILHERYFQALYCLYPVEWYAPEHTWVFGDTGIFLMVGGMIFFTGIIYYEILWRCMERV